MSSPIGRSRPDDRRTRFHDGLHEADGGAVKAAGVTARIARESDAPALATLATELGYPVDAEAIARRLTGLLSGRDDVVFVAVADETEIVGFVHAAEKRLLVSDPFVELEGLIVTAAARRRGAAACLIAAVERWTLARAVTELRVRARVERNVADLFYRQQGFALEKQQRVFAKRLAV